VTVARVEKARMSKALCIAAAWLLAFAAVPALAGGPEGSSTPASGTDPRSVDPRSPEQQIADAIEFRSEFGFPADPATVSALLADPATDYSFGAPLSSKELANMQERQAVRDKLDPAVAYIDKHPDDFGGVYFTQNTGDLVLYVLPTADIAPSVLDGAVALIPDGVDTRIKTVKLSMNELLKAQQRLWARSDDLSINEIDVQVADNNLGVVVAPTAKTSLAVGVADVPLEVTYGSGPEPATCVDSSSCTPYRGGIGIFSPQANDFCTWGFYGTRGAAAKYLMTAGHCAKLGDTETHLQVQVTDGVDRDTFDAGASAASDSMTAHVRGSSNAVSPFNTVYLNANDKAHTIVSKKTTATQHVGDPVCFEGGATGFNLCGTIEAVSQSYSLRRAEDGKVLSLTGQIRMSRVVKVGDSGGPVYYSHTAYGLVNALHGGDSHMLYSPIYSVESDMGTTICITTAC
jgi:hypothetical protein